MLQEVGGWAPFFFFFFPLHGWGLTRMGTQSMLRYLFTGAHFPVHTLKVLCSLHCPLHICARLEPLIHLIVQPFDQSMTCTEWEQIAPLLLLWPGPAHAQNLFRADYFPYWFKSLWVQEYISEPLLPLFHQSVWCRVGANCMPPPPSSLAWPLPYRGPYRVAERFFF